MSVFPGLVSEFNLHKALGNHRMTQNVPITFIQVLLHATQKRRCLGVITKILRYLGLKTCKEEENIRLNAYLEGLWWKYEGSHEARIWW